MLVYEKTIDEAKHIFGTEKNVPAIGDEELQYMNREGEELHPVLNAVYLDDGRGGIKQVDGTNVDVYMGSRRIVPATPSDIKPVDTVDELLAAIAEGGNIVVREDLTVTDGITLAKDAVIDFQGHKLENSEDIWGKGGFGLFTVAAEEPINVLIKNANFVAKENDCYAVNIVAKDSVVTLVDCNLNGNISAAQVNYGKLVIESGEFDVQQEDASKGKEFMLNCIDAHYQEGSAMIEVKGGLYHGFNPAANRAESSEPITNFVAEGFKSVDNGDGTFVVVVEE